MTPEQFSPFLNAVPLPLVLIDADGRLRGMNDGYQALFGDRGIGRDYVTVLRQPTLIACIERARADGRTATAQLVRNTHERSECFRVQAAGVTVEGRTGILVSFTDITDLQTAEKIRRDFVANVSHELKTPLTALMGFIETLSGAARNDPAAADRFLGIMSREAQRMNRLVSDLLSLSRVEEDERIRPRSAVSVGALIRSTLSALRPMIDQHDADVHFDDNALAAITVPGDADQLVQVFTNLVENAVKYGGGQVTIRLEETAASSAFPFGSIKVSFKDDGDGIDPIHVPRLTERFYRVDSHRSREMGGTGLGLAITKHIVNRHRGRLHIQSTPGAGACFTIQLPFGEGHTPPTPD